ncbi:MAG TPA: pyruvate dehydrogenase complex dihydrolipoamide acetyltransferase [Rhabdochlamydiaceae bacterium]
MPFTVTMPKLSPTMEEGTITKWHKKEGDYVKSGEVLIEVATDKATVEHTALDAGYLRKILIPNGKEAIVNQAIAIFTVKEGESIEGYKPEGAAAKSAAPAPSAEKKTETQSTAPAPKATGGAMQQPAFVPEPPLTGYVFPQPAKEQRASPLAKKLAQEKGVDLTTVKGTGPQHRVMSRDLNLAQPDAIVAFGRQEVPKLAPGTYEEEPLTPMRKIVGQRLQEAKTFIPHFYVTQDVNVAALGAIRDHLKNVGVKVSFNDLIVRATALALRKHPEVNSGFNSVNSSLIRFKTIDISVAVTVNGGLITPIIRHADYKNVGQISTEVKALAARAKEGKLAREEYTGGSFTISNLGMFGISEFIAVINPPQAAILAVGGIEEKPVVKNGHIVPGKLMRLTLSADHRVVDGADAAKFLKTLQFYLENPAMLLI